MDKKLRTGIVVGADLGKVNITSLAMVAAMRSGGLTHLVQPKLVEDREDSMEGVVKLLSKEYKVPVLFENTVTKGSRFNLHSEGYSLFKWMERFGTHNPVFHREVLSKLFTKRHKNIKFQEAVKKAFMRDYLKTK